MKNLEKAKIYRKRFEKLMKIKNPSPRLVIIIEKVQAMGLYYCLMEMYNNKRAN
jgi:hypothetical protein